MLTDSCCTLYLKAGEGFDRFFVSSCHWQERKAANVLKSGMNDADGVVVYLFEQELDELLVNTLKARKCAAQDLIIGGECSFMFDNSSPQKVSESMRALNAAYDVHTVMSIDRMLSGRRALRHFKLSAR